LDGAISTGNRDLAISLIKIGIPEDKPVYWLEPSVNTQVSLPHTSQLLAARGLESVVVAFRKADGNECSDTGVADLDRHLPAVRFGDVADDGHKSRA
jgi:hypothetical protein